MNGYDLSRIYWDFSFENPDKVKPYHAAIYFFAIEHCNRLGWKTNFGFPTSMVLEATGIKSYSAYKKYFDQLVEWGFFKVLEYSKNQFSSNIIALTFKDKALDKALDKAFIKHATKQSESTVQSTGESIDSIDKPINNKPINNKPLTNKPINNIVAVFSKKDFRKTLIDLGADEIHVEDWFKVRVNKKAAFTQTALKLFLNECEKNNFPVHEAVRICAEQGWKGFKVDWVKNLKSENGKQNNKTNREVFKSGMESEVGKGFKFK